MTSQSTACGKAPVCREILLLANDMFPDAHPIASYFNSRSETLMIDAPLTRGFGSNLGGQMAKRLSVDSGDEISR